MGGGGAPVVVQGTAVASPYDHGPQQQIETGTPERGEKQDVRCRDPVFAVLLYANVVAIAAVAGIYGADAFGEAVAENVGDAEAKGHNYAGYIYSTFILGAASMILTGATVPVMMCIPEILIKASLILMLVLSGLMVVFSFVTGNVLGGIFGLIFFLIFGCYARAAWSRIPFASINLLTACTAVRKNCGVLLVAYLFVLLAFGWTLLWSVSLMGVWEKVIETDVSAYGQEQSTVNWGYFFLLLLSYFFTHQVIQNTTHVTVAGAVGSWWFAPEDSGCCSSGVLGSACRALTTSFGSVCFGSLLVAIVQAVKALAQSARNNDNQMFVCIAECILSCIESLLEYFNKWAFIYVGLYGYSYLEAGKAVFGLFRDRGWEAIIADDLVGNVFFFLSLCVGGICAAFGYAIGSAGPDDWFENSPAQGNDAAVVAGLGFLAGLVLSSILMSTIASAVNAVIVCFAEGPAEFEANHPELSRRMRETWLEFYPECGA